MGLLIALVAVVLIVIGTPLFVVLGIVTMACVYFLGDGLLTEIIADIYNAVNKDVLLAIPFFIIAGALMTAGGISRRLIDVAKAALGWLPGGLAVATVGACMFFAAISGSSPVTVIAIGTIMFPALVKEKYAENFGLGLVTSAGSLGILIPPSIPMIIYAIMVSNPEMQVAVGSLFIAGIGPGLLIGALLMCYAIIIGARHKMIVRAPFRWRELGKSLRVGIWALLLPLLILGGIYTGWFTATEAAAVAVVYAFFVELFIHREVKIKDLPKIFVDSSLVMGTLFMILVIAMSFNQFLALEQIPQQAAEALTRHISSQIGFLLMANVLLLIVGCFMDIMSAILIIGPILAPIAFHFGIDPVHFGIVFIVNLEIGYLTPPMGINLFVASSVFGKPLLQTVRAALPFTLILLGALGLITYFPTISLWLVNMLK